MAITDVVDNLRESLGGRFDDSIPPKLVDNPIVGLFSSSSTPPTALAYPEATSLHCYLSGVTYQTPGPYQYQVTILLRQAVSSINVSNAKFADLTTKAMGVTDILDGWTHEGFRVLSWPVEFQTKATHEAGLAIQAEANILIGTDLYE